MAKVELSIDDQFKELKGKLFKSINIKAMNARYDIVNKTNEIILSYGGRTIAVWMSCGAPSAVASDLAIKKYGANNTVLIINNPVDEEHEDNRRFLSDVEKWIGQDIIIASNSKINTTSAYEVWEKRKYMSGIKGAPCTTLLKKEARYEFERNNHIDFHILGFTKEEENRQKSFVLLERENTIPLLINEGITRDFCFGIFQDLGIKLPLLYYLLFPNANCIGCVKSQSPTYWQLVRKHFPAVFKSRSEQSRRLGVRLVVYKGKRIFLDELPLDATGGKIKSWDCGIFCDVPELNFTETTLDELKLM